MNQLYIISSGIFTKNPTKMWDFREKLWWLPEANLYRNKISLILTFFESDNEKSLIEQLQIWDEFFEDQNNTYYIDTEFHRVLLSRNGIETNI